MTDSDDVPPTPPPHTQNRSFRGTRPIGQRQAQLILEQQQFEPSVRDRHVSSSHAHTPPPVPSSGARTSSITLLHPPNRRHTLAAAKDALLRRFSTATGHYTHQLSAEEIAEQVAHLVHEACQEMAAYRQLVQQVGTQADTAALRKELQSARKQTIKHCDNTKATMIPQLKTEAQDGEQSMEFTKQASQFIAGLGSFVAEMRRCEMLMHTFDPDHSINTKSPITASSQQPQASSSSASHPGITLADSATSPELIELANDVQATEAILETLENVITVHYPTHGNDGVPVVSRTRRKGCHLDWVCNSFKTSYA